LLVVAERAPAPRVLLQTALRRAREALPAPSWERFLARVRAEHGDQINDNGDTIIGKWSEEEADFALARFFDDDGDAVLVEDIREAMLVAGVRVLRGAE
jgi:hypothetical protein